MTGGGLGGSKHPEYVKNMSDTLKALAADPVRGPEWRKKLSEGHRRSYANNPALRELAAAKGRSFKGRTYSPETIERMRAAAMRRPPMPEEQRRQMSEARKGKRPYIMTDEIRQHMAEASRKRANDPAIISKMAQSMRTSVKARAAREASREARTELLRRPEMRAAQSERARLAMADPVRRAFQSAVTKRLWAEGICKGRAHSDETRKKISESRKRSAKALAAVRDPERCKKHSEFMKQYNAQKRQIRAVPLA